VAASKPHKQRQRHSKGQRGVERAHQAITRGLTATHGYPKHIMPPDIYLTLYQQIVSVNLQDWSLNQCPCAYKPELSAANSTLGTGQGCLLYNALPLRLSLFQSSYSRRVITFCTNCVPLIPYPQSFAKETTRDSAEL
jgi:hypothetical protein